MNYDKIRRMDNKLTAMMVNDFIHDPILASKVLLDMEVPPHQEIRMLSMWTTYFTIDDSGFSTGKSTTLAIISALRSILFPYRISGIVSGTFRQGKLIFQNFDKWYASSKIFRNLIQHQGGKKRIIHGQEAHEAHFRGGSIIRVLPPNFTQNADRLRSERWNDGYFDEWVVFDLNSLTKTLFGRVSAANDNLDCPIKQNHIHLSSTPKYTYEPCYEIVRTTDNMIARGSKDHSHFTCNYRHIPRGGKWDKLVDRKTIFTMQTMNPVGVVKSEVDGRWQKDSLTYYGSKDTDAARGNIPLRFRRQSEQEVYVAAFDTARGGPSGKLDDYSVTVIRTDIQFSTPQHVCTVRKNNIKSKNMAGIIHYLHGLFGFSAIVYDPGGGGLFVRDDLEEQVIPIMGVDTEVTPIIEMFNTTGIIGEPILVPFKRSSFFVDLMWGKMRSESVFINRLHKEVNEIICNNQVMLAPKWSGWDGKEFDVRSMRDWLNKNSGLSETERMRAEMDLAVRQLALVDVERNKEGTPKIDSYGMYKFKSKEKKDSAYSLIYSIFAYKLFKFMVETGFDPRSTEDGNDSSIAIGAM